MVVRICILIISNVLWFSNQETKFNAEVIMARWRHKGGDLKQPLFQRNPQVISCGNPVYTYMLTPTVFNVHICRGSSVRFNKTWLGQNFSRMEEVKFLLIHSNIISFLAVTVTCVFKPQNQHIHSLVWPQYIIVLVMRICFTIKASFLWWSFCYFSQRFLLMKHWYCKEKFEVGHPLDFKS